MSFEQCSNYGLQGKTAIITGGGTLMGHGIVDVLAQQGVNIIVADIDNAGGEASVAHHDNAIFVPTDITQDSDIEQAIAVAQEKFPTIDILVNLACTYMDDGSQSDRSSWLEALNVNLVSTAIFSTKIRPILAQHGGGSIINFGSISAGIAQAERWLYPVSKAAIVQLTKNMALDFVIDKIRVNSISPGWTWSKIMDTLTHSHQAKADSVAEPFHILGRVGNPQEIGQVIAFLCSDSASFVTGANWAVDGGYSALGSEQKGQPINLLSQ